MYRNALVRGIICIKSPTDKQAGDLTKKYPVLADIDLGLLQRFAEGVKEDPYQSLFFDDILSASKEEREQIVREWLEQRKGGIHMGLLSGLMGNASTANQEEVTKEIGQLLAQGEEVDVAFKLVRDLIVFTDKRLILVDKQGLTGKKVEYHSIPYKSISHFSVETAGHFDLDAELKIWISSASTPTISRQFRKDKSIYDIQKILATVCGQ